MIQLPEPSSEQKILPWSRVAILLAALIALSFVSYRVTGAVIPSRPEDALIFQNALLLVILGSALLEHKFTKPADSVVNALMGALTLIAVYGQAPRKAWWIIFLYCIIVFVISAACTAVSSGKNMSGWQDAVARITYRPAVVLGSARRLYSVLFLFGVLTYYKVGSIQAAELLLFWGFFIVLWPLGVPELLSSFKFRSATVQAVGKVVRTDAPNIVRCALNSNATWSRNTLKIYQQADGNQRWVLPLYSQIQEETLLGTGLCISDVEPMASGLEPSHIYDDPSRVENVDTHIATHMGGSPNSKLVGFVVEDSEIGQIRFETWDPAACCEGMLVWCRIGDKQVFYQITNGLTREEPLESDRHGFQIAVASQLGTIKALEGFQKYDWLPPMNTPVFSEPISFGTDLQMGQAADFSYGVVPGSRIEIKGNIAANFDHHTAILGVTGSGKTELAFDMIRHAAAKGIKVLCIDLTSKYEGKLADLTPRDLSITHDLAEKLGQKLFDVETGQYGAGKEKKVLEDFANELRTDISKSVEDFLCSTENNTRVGIVKLEEISNTKATLYITELYLTCLLRFAKDKSTKCPKTLIVVEEAHTVMPEPATMGLGDFDSKGIVGKIAQIALQGRKYGVGLLVIAQRTATVSKSVLTQCNTIISFTCFDDTSLSFLKNIFGTAHIALIPNLAPLQAVIFGRAVRSQRPIVVQIPYDQKKADTRV